MQPLPAGVPGDLFIGGDVLADGYLNRPDLTTERFLPDPFAAGDVAPKLYKTGDLARYFTDGNIEFLGRADHQVKVRGFRVEAGEIEVVIMQIEGVREVVVKPHTDTSGQNYLVAYIVASVNARNELTTLNHLRAKLPDYMVPAHLVFLNGLPLTPNGKIDRAALLPPEKKIESRPLEAPRDEYEAGIATVWAEILGLPAVGRNDNFFALGGHSLRAAQAVARLQDRFNVDLRLPRLFEKPTVATLAEEIKRLQGCTRTAIVRKPNVVRAPASLIQQRFWFLDRNIADRTIYNVADAIRIHGPLDVNALQKAWQALVDRQDSLRTTFVNADGWPEQVVHPPSPIKLPLVDLSSRPDAESEAKRMVAQNARQPFDVPNGPLWRAQILKLNDDQHLLMWTIHHIAIDESSRTVLLNDLWEAYAAAIEEKSAARPELPVRYLDYSLWQRDQVTPEAVAYWKNKLKGTPPPIVPPHPKTRPTTRTFQGSTVAFEISPVLAQTITGISREAGVTPYIAWLAAYQALLFRYTGQPDVCIGSPVSTRPGGARDVLGCFVNTLVLRTDLGSDPTFRELLGRARETLMGAIQHGDVPFEKLVEELRPERTPGGHPLFQSLFIYQAEDLHGTAAGGLNWRHDQMERVGAKFDFTLTIEEQEGRTTGYIEYAHDLYDSETIDRYIGHFQTLLEGIAKRPDAKVSELPILPTAERERTLHAFNATTGAFPSDRCVHQLVEAQVERTPDAVAFQFHDETLTFRQLNEKANRLAHHLRTLGVGPDTLVGLCVGRSLDLPMAMLGILKSGGAYVPLDPLFPPDRLSFYISDSKMPVIVAHETYLSNLPVDGVKTVRVDADAEMIAKQPATNPEHFTKPDHLINVLYTSGSTGRPNSVMIQHRSLVNLLWSFKDAPGLTARDTILGLTTISFDTHSVETWLAMIVGARCIVVPQDHVLNGNKLNDLIVRLNVNVIQSTPSMWRLIIGGGLQRNPKLKGLVGGEGLPPEVAQQMLERCGEVWNVYGPTETTVWSVIHPVKPTDPQVLIGKPILNTQTYVLDPNQQPMPIGCVGEVWIGGDGLARGYRGRQELTDQRFVPWSSPDEHCPVGPTKSTRPAIWAAGIPKETSNAWVVPTPR